MKYLLIITTLLVSVSLSAIEKKQSKKVQPKVSEAEKLKNIKRYYPKEYFKYDRGCLGEGCGNILPHPLMTGIFFNYQIRNIGGKELPKYPPLVDYPININIYKDKLLRKKVGRIHFTEKKYPETGLNGSIIYNGEEVCTQSDDKMFSLEGGIDIEDSCKLINYFAPYIEVNTVHKNSYEIKQTDGSSIFLSKKEMKPYVYEIVKSDRDYLRDNKILTEKQLEQAAVIFEKVKKDLYKLSKEEFIKAYYGDRFWNKHKAYYVKYVDSLRGYMQDNLFERDYRFSKTYSKKNKIEFEYSVNARSGNIQTVTLSLTIKNNMLNYDRIDLRWDESINQSIT